MAKPTAVTELGGSKVLLLADSTAVTPVAKTPTAIVTSASGEATYPVGWMGIATHGAGEAIGSPGGFSGASRTPVVVIGGSDGTNAQFIRASSGTPGATEMGMVVRNVPTGTQNVTMVGSNSVALLAGAAAIGTVAVTAGTSLIGGTRKTGWDHVNVVPQRGTALGVTATTSQVLLASDASNLYNVMDVTISCYTGTTAPGAFRYVSIRHNSTTEFIRFYIPRTADLTFSETYSFQIPDRGALNNNVDCILSGALGTTGEFSVLVHAYKSTS